MTQPRRLLPEQAHTICRRTLGRRFFLAPTRETKAIVDYALILSCSRHAVAGLEVSGFCSLSSHYHGNTYDSIGGADSPLPQFVADFNSLVARALNAKLDRGGPLWSGGSYSNVEVHGYEAEVAQYVYVAAQPVAAGLVERPEDWPGTIWLPEMIGTVVTARRPPNAFFGTRSRLHGEEPRRALHNELAADEEAERREGAGGGGGQKAPPKGRKKKSPKRSRQREREVERQRQRRDEKRRRADEDARTTPARSTLPEEVSYRIPIPSGLKHLGLKRARRVLRKALDARVAELNAERRAAGRGYPSPRTLREVDVNASAGDDCPTFARNPRVASLGISKQDRLLILDQLVVFRQEHAEGFELLDGETPWRARFPRGSYRRARELRRVLAALAQPPPRGA